MLRLTSTLVLALGLSLGCGPKPQAHGPAPGEQPLPPASGTAIGYLIDSSGTLELTAEQTEKLKSLDAQLSVRNEAINTQLREIEVPEEQEAPDKHETEMKPQNWAPGGSPTKTTADSGRLHKAIEENTKEALDKAWAVLGPKQQDLAAKLLADRGIQSPKASVVAKPPENPKGFEGDETPVPQEP